MSFEKSFDFYNPENGQFVQNWWSCGAGYAFDLFGQIDEGWRKCSSLSGKSGEILGTTPGK